MDFSSTDSSHVHCRFRTVFHTTQLLLQNSLCLSIADRAWATLWTARALHSTTAPSIRPESTRTSSVPDCWWADKSQRWAYGFECRNLAPNPREGSAKGTSCCDSSSTHRWASSWAQRDWCDRAAMHRVCLRVCEVLPLTIWTRSCHLHYRCDLLLAASDLLRPAPAAASMENPELCWCAVSHSVVAGRGSWCPAGCEVGGDMKKKKRLWVIKTAHTANEQKTSLSEPHRMSNWITSESHDDLQLLGRWCEHEFVDFLALVAVQRHWKAVCTFDENVMQLLEYDQNFFLQDPLELLLL